MALVRKASEVRPRRESEAGWRNALSRIVAGTAQGIDEVTMRVVTLQQEGRTPRREYSRSRIIYIIRGNLIFMDGDGTTNMVGEGDCIVTRPHERHHLQNQSGADARILMVDIS